MIEEVQINTTIIDDDYIGCQQEYICFKSISDKDNIDRVQDSHEEQEF